MSRYAFAHRAVAIAVLAVVAVACAGIGCRVVRRRGHPRRGLGRTSSDAALVAQVGALNNCDLIQAVIERAAEKREEFLEQMDPEGDESAFSEALDGFNRNSALSQKAIERDAIVGCAELLPLLSDG